MQEIEDIIQEAISDTYCYVCYATVDTPHNATAHYNSRRHKQNVKFYREELLLEKKQKAALKKVVEPVKTNQKDNFSCLICNVFNLNETEAAAHDKSDEHMKNKDMYCKPCNIRTMSKDQIWEHMKDPQHYKRLKELGLPAINVHYSPFNLSLPLNLRNLMLPDACQVCHKKFSIIKEALDHYGSNSHYRYIHWEKMVIENQSSEKNILELPKTNSKENDDMHTASSLANIKTNHNETKIHHNLQKDDKDVKEQVFQEINKLEQQSFSDKSIPELPKTDSKENIDMHSASSIASIKTNPIETKINLNSQKDSKDVKEQVFQEIDKLVKTLYYSKTVPYDVALEYLKNINKEVESLKRKYEKKGNLDVSTQYGEPISEFRETLRRNNLGRDFEGENLRNNIPTNLDFCSISNSDFPKADVTLEPNLNAANEEITTGDVEVVSKEYITSNGSYIQVEEPNKGVKKKTVELDEIYLQNLIHLEEQDNLDTLFDKIVLLKNLVKDDVERDVLSEIEKLIMLVNSDDILPDETLMYLQEFNRELDQKDFGNRVEKEQKEEDNEDETLRLISDASFVYKPVPDQVLFSTKAKKKTLRPFVNSVYKSKNLIV